MIRAAVFDLDDTLFPEREYAFSGFAAVAGGFADVLGDPDAVAAEMRRLFDTPHRSRVFNAILRDRGLAEDTGLIAGMIQVYRAHRPVIHLHDDAAAALIRLQGHHKLGLITDGPAMQQWVKIDALRLRERFDHIIVTSECEPERQTPLSPPLARGDEDSGSRQSSAARDHGSPGAPGSPSHDRPAGAAPSQSGPADAALHPEAAATQASACVTGVKLDNPYGKPHPLAFQQMSVRLGVAAEECVYVADNPQKDFIAPNRLGWRTVQVRRPGGIYADGVAPAGGEAQSVITSLDELDAVLS